jgi:hypothetical protein
MAERRPYLLRLDPEVLASLRQWAADDLRSVNGQIEFLLRCALREAGRLRDVARERPDATPGVRPPPGDAVRQSSS